MSRAILGVGALFIGGVSARASVIASDSFLTTSTSTTGNYLVGNLNGQTATNGTTGYFTGAAGGNPAPGWTSGTAADLASTTALTHPLTVNAPTGTPDGSLFAGGNANTRLQYRDFASTTPPASPTYFFSTLLTESANSYTGTNYVGLGPSRVTGGNALTPTTGFDVGYLNGALTLFYNNGGAALATQTLIASPTINSTYLAEVAVTGSGAATTLTPKIYNAAGVLVNDPLAQTVTATLNAADMGAFQVFQTINFSNGSPAAINYDELRFGTVESDVVAAPEPASLAFFGMSLALLARRRRGRRAREI